MFTNSNVQMSACFAIIGSITSTTNGLVDSVWNPRVWNHSHKKQKGSMKTRTLFSWILILTWKFGGGRSDSASTFFKITSASWFWCYYNYNWRFYMLDNDNISSTCVSEVVEKIPTDEKHYRKCSFMSFTLHSHSSYKEQTNI